MKPGSRAYNANAISRLLSQDSGWALQKYVGAFGRIITVLYCAERNIGIEIGVGVGRMMHGRVWSHHCPLRWRSKRLGDEASVWTDRHIHLDAVGKPEV